MVQEGSCWMQQSFYENSKACVKVNGKLSEGSEIGIQTRAARCYLGFSIQYIYGWESGRDECKIRRGRHAGCCY